MYLADNISTSNECTLFKGKVDDALRCNQLFAITLGVIDDKKLIEQILISCEKLLVPGAIRSLADQNITYSEKFIMTKIYFRQQKDPIKGFIQEMKIPKESLPTIMELHGLGLFHHTSKHFNLLWKRSK